MSMERDPLLQQLREATRGEFEVLREVGRRHQSDASLPADDGQTPGAAHEP
jgi:hypothetical protein